MYFRYYKSVPPLRKDDNVLPPASEIPAMLSKTRKRTISVGPQSEADVREFIANRDQQRKDSLSSGTAQRPSRNELRPSGMTSRSQTSDGLLSPNTSSAQRKNQEDVSNASLQVNGGNSSPIRPSSSDSSPSNDGSKEDEQQDRKMFSALEKPRIRYDVEVITKLVVYAGIAWLAVEGNPLLFESLGLVQ